MASVIFGTGELQISATAGLMSIGRLQNISINIAWETAQLRGGTRIFPGDTQFFDGTVEGTFQNGDLDLSNIAPLLGGAHAAAGGSGTTTLTGNSRPTTFKLILSAVTNGITATITLQRVYIPGFTLDFTRTEYVLPQYNFICESTTATGLMTIKM